MLGAVWPAWMGDIHAIVDPQWVGVIATAAAILSGGLIGIERGRAQKPAGLRTMILICMGSAVFAQASILMADSFATADRTRIAAQVVTGIGFLGAGAIIRERGRLIGITTGAGIWATAAVGLVIGSGHVAAGVFFAFLIVGTLAGTRGIERILLGQCDYAEAKLVFDERCGKARVQIDHILSRYHIEEAIRFTKAEDTERQTAVLRYCRAHRHHRSVLHALAALESVSRISID